MKTSLIKISWLVSLAILGFICMRMTMADQNQSGQPADAFATRTAISLWNYYFQEHVKKGDDVDKVKEILVHKTLDWGKSISGGTGNYIMCFKLDDFMQAEFQFDKSNKLQSYRVFRQRASWIKDLDGNILYQSDK
jgi:hypothetical protein